MYADFVAGLVPAYFPARIFWAYLTGAAMVAAGVSFIVNRKSSLAAVLLGAMLVIFILLIHIPKLSVAPTAIDWTRALQDLAIAASAFILAGALSKREESNKFFEIAAVSSRYLLAILLIIFGVQQFLNLDFLTAKVPDYLPLRIFWAGLLGAWMILTGVSNLINKKARLTAILLGVFLLVINLLFHSNQLVNNWEAPLNWTAAMLDLAITCGVFFLAAASPKENQEYREDL